MSGAVATGLPADGTPQPPPAPPASAPRIVSVDLTHLVRAALDADPTD
ncbi:hypothetical protein AB0N73_06585 [Microbacterium sp. NPDC089189]